MPRMNLSNTKPLCLNTVRQATRANKTTKQCRCALTQWGGKKLDQSARKEVLCLNTELQPLAARSSKNPTPKRRAEKEKGRGSKCCALTQSQLPQRRKQDRKNQSPEGKRGRKTKERARWGKHKQHTDSPSLRVQYLSTAQICLSQIRARTSTCKLSSVKVRNETDEAQRLVPRENHPKRKNNHTYK